MIKCDCYHSAEKILCWPPDEAPITIKTGSCWGTKEREECYCDGDRTKCDFYSEVRAKANMEKLDHWIITENGCVITCPNCGERLELCYPDGTEVRYLPHCPWCGKKLEEKK